MQNLFKAKFVFSPSFSFMKAATCQKKAMYIEIMYTKQLLLF